MKELTLGYLGPPGTFSEEAAEVFIRQIANPDLGAKSEERAKWRLLPLTTINDIVESVAAGSLTKGIIPLENSIEGSINIATDCIMENPNIRLEGEVIIDVDHSLAVKESDSSDFQERCQRITTLYSHPQALAQCQRYIREQLPQAEIRYASSTAEAANLVANGGIDQAAICSRWAASVYGLEILASKIQDHEPNQTRFGVIGLGHLLPTGDDKTSIVFSLNDQPGSLFSVLEMFAKGGINLTRIESRPSRLGIGKYYFLLDFAGHENERPVCQILKEIKKKAISLRVLGSYPCFQAVPWRLPAHSVLPVVDQKFKANPPVAEKIAIIGMGLIGGSLGLALKNQPYVKEVVGTDKDSKAVERALERQAIHRGWTAGEARDILNGVDIVIVAAPIAEIKGILAWIYPFLPKGCLVTDVASCKTGIVNFARTLSSQAIPFIGGHPLAGSEQQGIQAADRYLFENAAYILTPFPESPAWAVEKLKLIIESIGARVLYLSPEEHDRIVASISHLPHITASALVNAVGDMEGLGSKAIALASGGFRDTTRVASSNPELWAEILLENHQYVLEALEHFTQNTERVRKWLVSTEDRHSYQHLCDWLRQAQDLRASIPRRLRGLLPQQFDVIAEVPDQPGWIGLIGTLLGQHGINIADIQVLTVREGEAGSLRLTFAEAEEAKQAQIVLNAGGVQARCRGKEGV